jgi:hypothetical protein
MASKLEFPSFRRERTTFSMNGPRILERRAHLVVYSHGLVPYRHA